MKCTVNLVCVRAANRHSCHMSECGKNNFMLVNEV
jgi:hypothetical protein